MTLKKTVKFANENVVCVLKQISVTKKATSCNYVLRMYVNLLLNQVKSCILMTKYW